MGDDGGIARVVPSQVWGALAVPSDAVEQNRLAEHFTQSLHLTPLF
jgi:hypothetical protein